MQRISILTTVAIAAIIVAIGALVFSVIAVSKPTKTGSTSASILRLEVEVGSLRSEVRSLRGQLGANEEQVSKVRSTLSKFSTCIPELTNQISGLTAEVISSSVFLSQHSQISSYCKALLESH